MRETLEQYGWPLAQEQLLRDRGRWYSVMIARRDATPLPPAEGFSREDWFHAGPHWIVERPPALGDYWRERKQRAELRLEEGRGDGIAQARWEIGLAERVLATIATGSVR